MIRRVFSPDELSRLPKYGTEAQKIRALLLCYGTNYDFCRFFTAGNAIFGELNGAFVLCDFGECDYGELSEFFAFNGFSEIFCSEAAGNTLSKLMNCKAQKVNLMRYFGTALSVKLDKAPPLGEVYKILSSSFDIDYESWYLDMSHRVRHGVAQVRRLENSALVIQYDLNGEAMLSQIATTPEGRRRGNASRLISAVCAELSESEIFLICEDELRGFYERNGFIASGFGFRIFPGK